MHAQLTSGDRKAMLHNASVYKLHTGYTTLITTVTRNTVCLQAL